MAGKWICINCGEPIGQWDKICLSCGYHQFGQNDEFFPSEKEVNRLARKMSKANKNGNKKRRGYSDEEILALGLYPEDEGYKMSLISRILRK